MSKKLPEIWKYYFFIGIGLLFIHFIRFFNFYITSVVPIYQGSIDYEYYSNISLIIRINCLFISFFLVKYRNKYPVFFTAIAWLMAFLLLSHEYNIFLFIPVFLFTAFSFTSLIFYKLKNY